MNDAVTMSYIEKTPDRLMKPAKAEDIEKMEANIGK